MFRNLTSKLVAALLIGVVLFVSISLAVFYLKGPAEQPTGPEQPTGEFAVTWNVTWNVGDSWTSAINEGEYNLTTTVIGEEEVLGRLGARIDCYVVNLTFAPDTPYASTGMRNDMQAWFDKSSLRMVKVKASGTSYAYNRWWNWTYNEVHYYTVEGNRRDYNLTDEKHTHVYVEGVGSMPVPKQPPKEIIKTWIKEEAIENVTVLGVTYEDCFRMVVYDETGENVLSRFWFSEEVKTLVKSEDYKTGVKSELISYSIS